MPQSSSPRYERVFIGTQSGVLGTIPNSSGTATTGAWKLLRTVTNGCKLSAVRPMIPVPWKTGTRSTQPGISGKSGATFNLSGLPMILSGTAGTASDLELLLAGIFGVAGSVSAGVSVTYAFSDTAFLPFIIARYQHGLSALTQQLAFGCTPEEASWTLNGNIFEMSCSGLAYNVIDSENFANEDTLGKGGLTAYAVEPGTPTIAGAVQQGFLGVATFDSNAMDPTTAPLIACSVRVRTGNVLYTDNFGTVYASSQGGGERGVSVSATFQDTDSSALNNLKNKAKAKTPINVSLQVGTTAGSICTFTIKSVQLNIADYSDDGARITANFGESAAHASAIANIDDLVMICT